MAFDTAANVINDAAFELGLIQTTVADPFASSVVDANIIRLCRLLKGLGQDLLRDYEWQALTKTHTFSTSNGVAAYELPTDYARTIDQTHWNRTTDLPLAGPVGGPDWQYLQAVSVSPVHQLFRIFNEQVNISPTPSSTQTVAFEYVSRYWVRRYWQPSTAYVVGDVVQNGANIYTADTAGTSATSGGPTGTSTNITDNTARWDYTSALAGTMATHEYVTWGGDIVLFDRRLLVLGLKLQFKGDLGYEAMKADSDFAAAYRRARGADKPAPVLSIGGRTSHKYIDNSNLPDTGYGS